MTDVASGFRFVDLFAGLGGFHVALRELGGHGVFAAEWDPKLNEMYQKNFKLSAWSNINDLCDTATIRREVPEHDILAAGFPCQPFSKAGEQLGFGHTLQGKLFFKVLDILREKRPQFIILENVPNILKHGGGDTLRTIRRELEGIGYAVDVRKFSPHDFGIPQVRERAYFVGSLQGLQGFEWPVATPGHTDIGSVLNRSSRAFRAIKPQTLRAIDMWNDFLHRSESAKVAKLPSFPIWSMEFRATYPYADGCTPSGLWETSGPGGLDQYLGTFGFPLKGLPQNEQYDRLPSHSRRTEDLKFPSWKRTFIRQNRDFYDANNAWLRPWMNEWQPWSFPSSLQKFEWNVQGGERDIDKYVLQVRASGVRVKRTTTAPSLIAMTQTQVPILGKELVGVRRYMTPSECAALQSLDSLELPENDLQAYKALGNAVNARVVKAIAEPLLRGLGNPSVPPRNDHLRASVDSRWPAQVGRRRSLDVLDGAPSAATDRTAGGF